MREPTARAIADATAILRAGGVVGMPTETVYGLAGSARDASAIAMIFSTKERPLFDPLVAHLEGDPLPALDASGLVDLSDFDAEGIRVLRALATHAWPGPLTLVLPKTANVPDLATAGLPSVAVRFPDHPVAQALIRAAGPVVAPSANRFGRISPTRAEHVVAELGDRVGLVLDGGPCRVGVESTILALAPDGSLQLLRPGGTAVRSVVVWTGRVVTTAQADGRPLAPGMLPSHYAPRTRLILLDAPGVLPDGLPDRVGLLRMSPGAGTVTAVVTLSADGDLAEMARNLFAGMRALDDAGVDVILVEPPPTDDGLGHAIRDRLLRASWQA